MVDFVFSGVNVYIVGVVKFTVSEKAPLFLLLNLAYSRMQIEVYD